MAKKLIARGSITISKMDDVYEIKLAPWTVSIPSNSDGSNPVLASVKTRLIVNKDAALISTTITSLTTKNCTATFLGNEVSITSVSADSGEVEIVFDVEDQTRSAVFTWTKAKQGSAGTDAYTVVLGNESHAVPATSSGGVTAAELDKATSIISAWKGSMELTAVAANATPALGQYRYNITNSVGCTSVRVDNTSFKLSSMSADSAKVEVRIWVEGKQYIDKTMSITKARAGSDGEDGQPGPKGPLVINRDVWRPDKSYHGGIDFIEMVNYNGAIYYTKETAGNIPVGTLPTDAAYWIEPGIATSSIHADILSAITANISNLMIGQLLSNNGLVSANLNDDGAFKVNYNNEAKSKGIVMTTDINTGQPVQNFYNIDGELVWSLGQSGSIVKYITVIPEKWTQQKYHRIGDTGDMTTGVAKTNAESRVNYQSPDSVSIVATNTITYHAYYAGENPSTSTNKKYEGWHTESVLSTTNWMPTGLYIMPGTVMRILTGAGNMYRVRVSRVTLVVPNGVEMKDAGWLEIGPFNI